jgi:hypothetical protein
MNHAENAEARFLLIFFVVALKMEFFNGCKFISSNHSLLIAMKHAWRRDGA